MLGGGQRAGIYEPARGPTPTADRSTRTAPGAPRVRCLRSKTKTFPIERYLLMLLQIAHDTGG